MTKEPITAEMAAILDENGYLDYRIIPGRGIVALQRFIFTVGLCYGIDEVGYEGRWCYSSLSDARTALNSWDGVEDPPGEWIKHKGRGGEYSRSDTHKDEAA